MLLIIQTLLQQYNIAPTCINSSGTSVDPNMQGPYCYIDVSSLNKNINLFFINDANEKGLIIQLPNFSYVISTNNPLNMQYIIFRQTLRLSTNQPVIYILNRPNDTTTYTDTITVTYQPQVIVKAQYNSNIPVNCASIQLTNSTVLGIFTDTNTVTSPCPMRQEKITVVGQETVTIRYISCLGYIQSSPQVSVSMGYFAIQQPVPPILIYDTANYNITMQAINVQSVNSISLQASVPGTISNILLNNTTLTFSILLGSNVPQATTSLDFTINYTYTCNASKMDTSLQLIAATFVTTLALTFKQNTAMNGYIYQFTVSATDFCPTGTTTMQITPSPTNQWTCTQAGGQNTYTCDLSAQYNVSTDISNTTAPPGRVMDIQVTCDNTAYQKQYVFTDIHIPTAGTGRCLSTTMQSSYLDKLFTTQLDQCTKTRSSALTPVNNATNHSTNVTIITCTNLNVTYVMQDAYIDLTYSPQQITGGSVTITSSSNSPTITAIMLQEVNSTNQQLQCTGQSPTFTCTMATKNKDYDVTVTYQDACQGTPATQKVDTLIYPTSFVNVVCSGQCYVNLSNIITQAVTFQGFSYDSTNTLSFPGNLNLENIYIFNDQIINAKHVTNQSRFLGNENQATNLYAIVYDINYQITVGLSLAPITVCTNWTQLNDLYAANLAILDVVIINETCKPIIDTVYFGFPKKANITTTNCFNKTKRFENITVTVTSASVVNQSVAINTQNNSYILIDILNMQGAIQTSSVTLVDGTGAQIIPSPVVNVFLAAGSTNRYNITLNTQNLQMNQEYRLQIKVTSMCGDLETIYVPFSIQNVNFLLPITAACSIQNQCTYHIAYTLPLGLSTCNNQSVKLNPPTGGTAQSIDLNFTNGAVNVDLNSLFTTSNVSIFLNQTYTGESQSSCFNGQTFTFVDQTQFSITQQTNAACTTNSTLLLSQYFTFVNNCTQYVSMVAVPAGNILNVIYTSLLNVQYSFTFDYINCQVSVVQLAGATQNNLQKLYPNNNEIFFLNVTSQNIRNLTFYLTTNNQTGLIANFTINRTTSQWTLNTSGISSGQYDLHYNYTDLCGKDVTVKANATVIVPFYIDVNVSNNPSELPTLDFQNQIYDSNRTITSVGAIGPVPCTLQSCKCTDAMIEYTIQFTSTAINCNASNIYNVTIQTLQVAPMLFQITSNSTTNQIQPVPIMARLLQKNLFITNFSLNNFPTQYVCSTRYPESNLTLTFQNPPCPPTIIPGSIEYLSYNEVNLEVQFCQQKVFFENITFKISNLTIQNTSQLLICDDCFADFVVLKRDITQSVNAIVSMLTSANITLQLLSSTNTWTNISTTIVNFNSTASQATFRIPTRTLIKTNTYQLYISYFDVCFLQQRPQNATYPLQLEQVTALNIISQQKCNNTDPTCKCTINGLTWTVNAIFNYSVSEILAMDLSACFTTNPPSTIDIQLIPEINENSYTLGNSAANLTEVTPAQSYKLQIEFKDFYLVKTDKSNVSSRTYKITSTDPACNNTLNNTKYVFIDKTGGTISGGGAFCTDIVNYTDITYTNVDCCSSYIKNSTTSIALNTVSFTQHNCLDYNYTTITGSVEISAQNINASYNNITDQITVTISLQQTTSNVTSVVVTDSKQTNPSSAQCTSTSLATSRIQIYVCGASGLVSGACIVNVTLSSNCSVQTNVQIMRDIKLNITVPDWNINNTLCNPGVTPTFYTNITYSYQTIPANNVTIESDQSCTIKVDSGLKQFTITNISGSICNLILKNNITQNNITYQICVANYDKFDIQRCSLYFSDYDSMNVSTDQNNLSILNSTQNYNLRCLDNASSRLSHFQLSANSYNSITFTYGSETEIPVKFCEYSIGCFDEKKSISNPQIIQIPQNTSAWLNLEPQIQFAVLKNIAGNPQLVSMILNNNSIFSAARGVYLIPEFIDAVQDATARKTLLQIAFNHGLDQALQYAYFNSQIYSNAYIIYQKAVSELSITAAQQLHFVQKLLDSIVKTTLGLNIEQTYTGPNITISIQGNTLEPTGGNVMLVSKEQENVINIQESHNITFKQQEQFADLKTLTAIGLNGFGTASIIQNGRPFYLLFALGSNTVTTQNATINATFSGTTAGICFFADIQGRIMLSQLNLVSNGTQCTSIVDTVAQTLQCQCQNVTGQGVIYVTGGTFKAPTSSNGQNLPLIILNSCVLIAASALLAVSSYFLHKEKI